MATDNLRLQMRFDSVVTGLGDVNNLLDSLENLSDESAELVGDSRRLVDVLGREAKAQREAAVATDKHEREEEQLAKQATTTARAISKEIRELNRLDRASAKAAQELRRNARALEQQAKSANLSERAVGRLRGAIAGISAALVGREFLRANAGLETLTRSLAIVAGGAEEGRQELEFLRSEADRLGFNVGQLSQDYIKFTASLQGTNLEGERGREIFTNFTGALGNLGVETSKVSFVLNALGQIASKGTVSMEELRQQLGESLPAALRLFAESVGVSVEEVSRLIAQGQFGADTLLEFSRTTARAFGADQSTRINTYRAAVGRLGNAWDRLLTTVGGSGAFDLVRRAVEGSARLLRGLTEQISLLGSDSERGPAEASENVAGIGAAADDAKAKVAGLKSEIDALAGADQAAETAGTFAILTAEIAALETELAGIRAEIQRLRDLDAESIGFDNFFNAFGESLAELEQAEQDLTAAIAIRNNELATVSTPAIEESTRVTNELSDALFNLTTQQRAQLDILGEQLSVGEITIAQYDSLRLALLDIAPANVAVARAAERTTEAWREQFGVTGNLNQRLEEYQRLLRLSPGNTTLVALIAETNKALRDQGEAADAAAGGLDKALDKMLATGKASGDLTEQISALSSELVNAANAGGLVGEDRIAAQRLLGELLEKERKARGENTDATRDQVDEQEAATDEAGRTADATAQIASIGKIIRDEFKAIREEMAALSPEADRVFVSATRFANEVGSSGALAAFVRGLSESTNEAEDLESELLQVNRELARLEQISTTLRPTGLSNFVNAMRQAREATRAAFLEQQINVSRFFDILESGNGRAIRATGLLNRSAEDLRRQFSLLDESTLDKLTGQVRSLREETEAAVQAALDLAEAAQIDIARLQGDDLGALQLEQARELADLREQEQAAQSQGNIELLNQLRTSIDLVRERQRLEADAIRESARERQQPAGDDASVENTAAIERQVRADTDLDATRENSHRREVARINERSILRDNAARESADEEIHQLERVAAFATSSSSTTIRSSPLTGDAVRSLDRQLNGVRSLRL